MPDPYWSVVAVIDPVVLAVKEYHTVLLVPKHPGCGSAGSAVAAARSWVSEKGSAPIGVALATLSFPGGATWLTENCRLRPPVPPAPQHWPTTKNQGVPA